MAVHSRQEPALQGDGPVLPSSSRPQEKAHVPAEGKFAEHSLAGSCLPLPEVLLCLAGKHLGRSDHTSTLPLFN